jgi:membrane protease YdiL (CAAX protease family)
MVIAGLSVAGVGAGTAAVLYVLGRVRRERLLPPVRVHRRGWPGVAVAGAFVLFAVFGLVMSAVHSTLISAGFFRAVYGPDFPTVTPDEPSERQAAAITLRVLWTAAFTFPFQVLAIFGLCRGLGLPNPLHARGWRMNAVAGYLTWLIVTPAAFVVFVLAVNAHTRLTGLPPEKHPLTILGDAAGGWEWALFGLQTVVIAPILEEWLFRGVLLGWLAQARPFPPPSVPPVRRSRLVMLAAVGIGMVLAWRGHPADLRQAFATDPAGAAAMYLVPGAFLLLLFPVEEVLVRWHRLRRHLRLRSPQQVRAIVASSALFAAFHAGVWPSPVPLVVLAMGLGYLYLRTRSLVGPIVVHGLFNAVSATYLLIGGPT